MFESLRNCHFRFTCKMNMEVFEAADKVAAVAIAIATAIAMAMLIGTVAGGTERSS